MSTDITMIGLGSMGSALARAFLDAGHRLTVWNRTPERMEPLAAAGAVPAEDAAAAVSASPVIVLCIADYAATDRLLADADLLPLLRNRVLIQLSTGMPQEARRLGAGVSAAGAHYLDGAIMPYPDGIGAADAQILFAGPRAVYDDCKPLLGCLGGDLRYAGADHGAAAILDMALLTQELCGYLGLLHAARVCESEGISVETLAALQPEGSPLAKMALRIHRNDFDNPGATLEVWDAALEHIASQAKDAGINSEVPDFIASLFRRALARGHGQHEIAALVEVLRGE